MMKFKLIVIFSFLMVSKVWANGFIVDGQMGEWESMLPEVIGDYRTYVINDSDHVYIGVLSPNQVSPYIPIANGDITFFVPNKSQVNHTTWVNLDNNHSTGDTSEAGLGAEVKITAIGHDIHVEYLDGWASEAFSYSFSDDGKFVEIKLAKPGTLRSLANISVWTSHDVPFVSSSENLTSPKDSRADDNPRLYSPDILTEDEIQQAFERDSYDYGNVTVTIGGSLHGFGSSLAAGVAVDQYGFGGYGDATGGDASWGWSVDAGLFNGDIPDISGTTVAIDGGKFLGMSFETPVDSFSNDEPIYGTPGSGFTISIGPYIDILPGLEIRRGASAYAWRWSEPDAPQEPASPDSEADTSDDGSSDSSSDSNSSFDFDTYYDDVSDFYGNYA